LDLERKVGPGFADLERRTYPEPAQPRWARRFPGWVAIAAIGTGFVWASIGQGSGELLFWPQLIAKYGTAFVGWILGACLIQYFVNLEIGRYTVMTGETVFAGFNRLSPRITWILAIMILPSFLWFPAYFTAGGTALAELTNFPPGLDDRAQTITWGYISLFLFMAFVLARVVYRALERFMIVISILTVVGVVVACFQADVSKYASEYWASYFRPRAGLPSNWDPADSKTLITAVTFAGMGGFFNIFYSYWLRDRGVGLSAVRDDNKQRVIGQVTSPIRGSAEAIPSRGFLLADSLENRRLHKVWIRGLCADNALGVGINLFTVSLLGLLSFAILHPAGIIPAGWQVAVAQAKFFETAWGSVGRALFLGLAAIFLVDTWPGIVDGVSRMVADVIGIKRGSSEPKRFRRRYWIVAGIMTVWSMIAIPMKDPGTLLKYQGIFNFLAMVVYCPLLICLNYIALPKHLPGWTKPGLVPLLGILAATIAYTGLFVWYVGVVF